MANKLMKRYPTLCINREMQIKTTMRCCCVSILMAINQKTRKLKVLVRMWRYWNLFSMLVALKHGSTAVSNSMLLLLLLLSRFNRVRLCATPETADTRLPRPWDSPGKNTGVGCHFLLQCMKVKSESDVAQSCQTVWEFLK